jgi:transcriptional regulator with XRE-family HTH domain
MSDIFRDYSFGGWLRHYRKEKRLTLREMAKHIDMDAANYCRIEKSEYMPGKKETVLKLLEPLRLDKTQKEMMISLAFQHQLAILKGKWK